MQSEVARIKEQIETEFVSMVTGLSAFAEGTARHQFISRKLRQTDIYHQQLVPLVGEEQATEISAQAYIRIVG